MVMPAVTDAAVTWWSRMPEFYRAADALQNTGAAPAGFDDDGDNPPGSGVDDGLSGDPTGGLGLDDGDSSVGNGGRDYPLLRYLDGIGATMQAVRDIHTRVDAGDLVEATRADPGWLRWLAQMLGVHLGAGASVQAQRDAITAAASGWARGTRDAIAKAAAAALSGTRWVVVRPGTDPWTINVVIRDDEAPADLSTVAAAVDAAGQRPAGYGLVITTFIPTWDPLDTAYTDWDGIDVNRTWAQVDSTAA